MVSKVAEPAIKKLVDALNEELKKSGVMAGVDCRWFFDKLPETLVEEEPEVQVDETLVDVLRIFDEGQAKANSLYGLLDQAPSPTPPFCTNKINIDDYSEDSKP